MVCTEIGCAHTREKRYKFGTTKIAENRSNIWHSLKGITKASKEFNDKSFREPIVFKILKKISYFSFFSTCNSMEGE